MGAAMAGGPGAGDEVGHAGAEVWPGAQPEAVQPSMAASRLLSTRMALKSGV